jgi:hypothetical protein
MRESGRKPDPLYDQNETSASELAVSMFGFFALLMLILINLTVGAPH